jgi:hypothetical protein
MDLLERYLQAVGHCLPPKSKEDTLAELRANLLGEMDGREEELGRPLTEDEVAAVLVEHGRPMIVAARYLPQRHLIGPGLFPAYWYTLKRGAPMVAIVYAVVQAVTLAFRYGDGFSIGSAIGRFPGVLFYSWAVVTLVFAAFQYVQDEFVGSFKLPKQWDPRKLPPLEKPQAKGQSLANRVADLVISVVAVVWLLALGHQPVIFLGPGATYLKSLSVGMSAAWEMFYWQLIFLMIAQILLKCVALLRSMRPWQRVIDLVVLGLNVAAIMVLLQERTYFAATAVINSQQMKLLETINWSVRLGLQFALAVTVVKLLWDLGKLIVDSTRGNAVVVQR